MQLPPIPKCGYSIQIHPHRYKNRLLKGKGKFMRLKLTKQGQLLQRKVAQYFRQKGLKSTLSCQVLEQSDSQYKIDRKESQQINPVFSNHRKNGKNKNKNKSSKVKQCPQAPLVSSDSQEQMTMSKEDQESAEKERIVLSYEEDRSDEDITKTPSNPRRSPRHKRKQIYGLVKPEMKAEAYKIQNIKKILAQRTASERLRTRRKEHQQYSRVRKTKVVFSSLVSYDIEIIVVSDQTVMNNPPLKDPQYSKMANDHPSSQKTDENEAQNHSVLDEKSSEVQDEKISVKADLQETQPSPPETKILNSQAKIEQQIADKIQSKSVKVKGRRNVIELSLINLVEELFLHSLITQHLYQDFAKDHSTRDMEDFLDKFATGQLPSFDYEKFPFTLLDHRRIGQVLARLYPMEFANQGFPTEPHEDARQYLISSYQLTPEQYYKLYSKIDRISKITWWSGVLNSHVKKFQGDPVLQRRENSNKKRPLDGSDKQGGELGSKKTKGDPDNG